MSYFNFDIDTGANFFYRANNIRSTRDLLKITEAKRRWEAAVPDAIVPAGGSDRRFVAQIKTSHSIRRHDAQQVAVSHCLDRVENSNYRNFKIFAVRSSHSGWVAYFERFDGRPVFWEGATRSTMKTASYSSETLAIADAQISIDDLMASEPAAQHANE